MRIRSLLLVGALGFAVAAAGGNQQAPPRVGVRGGISIAVAPGWHVVRERWTRVRYPIPALAVATFTVRLDARRPCACDWPSVINLPRDGAFLFVWEYRPVPTTGARAYPRRPPRFRIPAAATPRPSARCDPSYGTLFRVGRRGFQVELYLGPDAGARVRASIGVILDSLRASSAPVSDAAPPA